MSFTALSGQLAVHKQMEVIANNLANMTTTGFKAERIMFEQALDKKRFLLQNGFEKDLSQPKGLKTDEFVQIRGSFTDFSVGPIEKTGNIFDFAIDVEGLFVIQTSEGERYTRAGNFKMDEDNRLVTQSGDPVQGSGGDLTVQGSDIQVSRDGTIIADNQDIGKFRIVKLSVGQMFRQEKQLFRVEGSVTDVDSPKLQGSSLEGSNVNAVRELADMIMTSRIFEALQKARDSSGDMNEQRNLHLGSTRG